MEDSNICLTKLEPRFLTPDTKGWKYMKLSVFPSDVLETAKIFNMRITNYDLGIPKRENRKGDHRSSEYFEADDDKDKIKIEKEDSEDKATVGKLGILKLRL